MDFTWPGKAKRAYPSATAQSVHKTHGNKLVKGSDGQAEDEDEDEDKEDKMYNTVNSHLQYARYAMKLLANMHLRSHAIMTLCDRSESQLTFFNRSVILVSSIVDIATREGQELFVLMLKGLHWLSPEDHGFYKTHEDSERLWQNYSAAANCEPKGGN
jgi:hypothetical protein